MRCLYCGLTLLQDPKGARWCSLRFTTPHDEDQARAVVRAAQELGWVPGTDMHPDIHRKALERAEATRHLTHPLE